MHPVLASKQRLLFYLLSWVVIAVLLTFLLASPGALRWLEAAAIVFPLSCVYAPVCLSAWYVCRAAPPTRTTGVPRVLLTSFAASLVVSSMWAGLARLAARAFPAYEVHIARHGVPLLFGAGVLLYLLSAAFHYVLLMADEARRAEAREMQAGILAREAELKALKAQINPHFLFNCLNSISALTSVDPGRARDMCVLLGEFLRSTLGLGERPAISLEDELALARSYLSVERVRFGARLRVEEDIEPGCGQVAIPPLLLQPLVENAVTHGVAGRIEGALVRVEARRNPHALSVVVENEYDPEAPTRRRNGVGLANVRRRLEAKYGGRARMDVQAADGRYRVSLLLPDQQEENR